MSVEIIGLIQSAKSLLLRQAVWRRVEADGKALKSVRRDIVQDCPSYASQPR